MGAGDQSQGTLSVQNKVSLNSNGNSGNVAEASAASYYYKKVTTYKKVAYYKHHKKYYKYKKVVTYKKVYRTVKAASVYTYSYSSGKGVGDCWTNSAVLMSQLTKAHIKARIIQYRTSLSSRHRSIQLYQNGKWVDYNYKANGYKKTYYATSSKPGMFVVSTN